MGLEAIEAELRKIDSVLGTARRLLAEGKSVDLSAIEDKVRAVCAMAEAAPAADRPPLLAHLETLLGDLDAVAEEIMVKHRELMGGGAAPTTPGAARAYDTADGLAPRNSGSAANAADPTEDDRT